ncbi:MAG: tRNA (adenosine(37)-N6)-threonylcarbamoyltransferase complex ATPase subunit type 1 TsaE [Minisyncoccia bacterium]
MKIISKSLVDTEEVARNFVEKLSVGFYDGACVVGLYGDLGSGKTTFTKAIAKILGVKGNITSPTFVIEKIYPISYHFFTKLIHIDAYRLESPEELEKLSWKEALSNSKNLILIEWPENVLGILPENHLKINFKFISENEREIEI